MNTVTLILIALAAAAVIVWASRRFIQLLEGDGYGHRPLPRSHHDDTGYPLWH